MRAIVAAAIFLLCLSSAEPEPEFAPMLPGSFHLGGGSSFASLVEIESSRPKGNRAPIAAPHMTNPTVQEPSSPASPQPPPRATSDSTPAPAPAQSPNPNAATTSESQASLDDVCNALLTSATDNGLPVVFFANLIWQESRLRDDAVSPKGALGIAQFMPKVAAESGLTDPFDPLQALSASARLLHALREQFGNLGFVAAAYNAGAKRVDEWLHRRRVLPRETRGYVVDVTGRSVEQWQKAPVGGADLHFAPRFPCRDKPAFVELEQQQAEQARAKTEQNRRASIQLAQTQPKRPERPHPRKAKAPEKAMAKILTKKKAKRERLAERRQPREPVRREKMRKADREGPRLKYEARERARRTARERHRRA